MGRLGRSVTLFALVAVTLFYPLVAPTPHRIDDAHFELIRVGMTQADVADIFGVPPGNYDWAVRDDIGFFAPAVALVVRGPSRVHLATHWAADATAFPCEFETRTWVSRHGAYRIHLGEGGEVLRASKLTKIRIEYPWHNWRRLYLGR